MLSNVKFMACAALSDNFMEHAISATIRAYRPKDFPSQKRSAKLCDRHGRIYRRLIQKEMSTHDLRADAVSSSKRAYVSATRSSGSPCCQLETGVFDNFLLKVGVEAEASLLAQTQKH